MLNILSLLNPDDFENVKEHIIEEHFSNDAARIEEEISPIDPRAYIAPERRNKCKCGRDLQRFN